MGYGNSVQFFGKQSVLKAFENSDCSNWSILQGRQFMFKYEGCSAAEARDNLSALLDMIISSSASDAVYVLRTYDLGDEPQAPKARKGEKPKEPKKRKIYESTDFDGSFNFKLFGSEFANPSAQRYGESQELKAELQALREQVAEMQKENEGEPEEKLGGLSGTLMGLLEVPEIKQAVIGKVLQLVSGVSNKIGSFLNPEPVAKIAGTAAVAAEPPAEPIQLPADQVNKLNQALTALVQLDKNFPDHLYKLAMIATNNPALYQNLITMLNNMST